MNLVGLMIGMMFAANALNNVALHKLDTEFGGEIEVLALSLPHASAPRRFSSQDLVGSGSVEGLAMGAIETTILVVVALILGWGAVEIACKPCMESGRAAINRSLDPDYDPDDAIASTPYVEAPRPVEKEEEPAFPESRKKSYKVVKGEPSDI